MGRSSSAAPFNNGYDYEAFRWQDGVMTGLGFLPPAPYSQAKAVSADGAVVVGQAFGGGMGEAFRWQNGVMTGLGFLAGGDASLAFGISGDGSVVVGRSHSENSGPGADEAFRWQDGVMTGLGDLPGGGFNSTATSVSPDGNFIIGFGISDSGPEAFRWVNGVMTGLGDLPGGDFTSVAHGVSGDGSVVVGYSDTDRGSEAYIWDAQHGMRNLREVLVNDYGQNLTGWTLTEATAVTPDGRTVIGNGTNPSGQPQAWIATLAAGHGPITVFVDVKPGDGANPVNLAASGLLPVAVLGSATFDVSTVNVASVRFAGAPAVQSSLSDVNGDGRLDLMVHFRLQDTNLRAVYADLLAGADASINGVLDLGVTNHQTDIAVLTGQTMTGDDVVGSDSLDLFMAGKALRDLLTSLAQEGLI